MRTCNYCEHSKFRLTDNNVICEKDDRVINWNDDVCGKYTPLFKGVEIINEKEK